MAKEKNPANREKVEPEIDPAVGDVMEEHTRAVSGKGPNVAKEAQRKRAIVRAALRAI
jgi:hypothetical protein